jgi:hypothetical protein
MNPVEPQRLDLDLPPLKPIIPICSRQRGQGQRHGDLMRLGESPEPALRQLRDEVDQPVAEGAGKSGRAADDQQRPASIPQRPDPSRPRQARP